jgi:hypothetical protein
VVDWRQHIWWRAIILGRRGSQASEEKRDDDTCAKPHVSLDCGIGNQARLISRCPNFVSAQSIRSSRPAVVVPEDCQPNTTPAPTSAMTTIRAKVLSHSQKQCRQKISHQMMTSAAVPKAVATTISSGV